MDRELSCRITLVEPPPGVTFQLQKGRHGLVPPSEAAAGSLSFDFHLRVREGRDGGPNFLGEFVQGPPAGRFIYVNSGTSAGQHGSPWTRRAKVHLAGINWELVEAALSTPGGFLEARIAGTSRDGGPACATVPLLDGQWKLSHSDESD